MIDFHMIPCVDLLLLGACNINGVLKYMYEHEQQGWEVHVPGINVLLYTVRDHHDLCVWKWKEQ